jgi:hypothetical protein
MSFTNSAPITIALRDPVLQYGNGYRVANIYLTSSSEPQTSYHLAASYTNPSVYQQNFQTKYLNIAWSVISPSDGYTYTRGEEIEKNPFISGFNIDIYKNSGNLVGLNTRTSRTKVLSSSGIKGNTFLYEISGDDGHRNYSAEITLIDFTGNKSSGLLTSRNLGPGFKLLETGVTKGVFVSTYSGLTGPNGRDESNGFGGVNLYNVTGLTTGGTGYFLQGDAFNNSYARSSLGNTTSAIIELSPGVDNYVMAAGRDQYTTGSVQGFFNGASGVSGFRDIPWLINYPIEISPITGYRVLEGEALYYSFLTNYNTGSSLIETCYGITGTGEITGAVSGYTGEIFLDSGILFDASYNKYNTGEQYVYDNSLSLQSGLYTGTLIEVEVTGIGFTGTGTVGDGAGGYWAYGCPKYSGAVSGISGGIYNYGYYDSISQAFGCTTEREISGRFLSVEGAYSMPKNNPNSHDIRYRPGSNYSQSYEQAAAFLNAQGEMPAVIINPTQLQKLKSLNGGRGWVGLKRNKVSILTGLFSEDFKNQTFFNESVFETGESRNISTINTSHNTESNRLEVTNIGEHWCWVNSGSHIYKYAGTGYNKVRNAGISIDVKKKLNRSNPYYLSGNDGVNGEGYYYPLFLDTDAAGIPNTTHKISGTVFHMPKTGTSMGVASAPDNEKYTKYTNPLLTGINMQSLAVAPQFESLAVITGDLRLEFIYTFVTNYYNAQGQGIQADNYNASRVDLHTGTSPNFVPGSDNIYSTNTGFSASEGVSFLGTEGANNPTYFQLVPFDTISSGVAVGNGSPIRMSSATQSIIKSLDDQFNGASTTVDVDFPFLAGSNSPNVTQTLAYTGTLGTPTYIGAMLGGATNASGASFILTAPPSATGYVLYIEIT